jgi:hypothetical protein
MAKQKPIKAQAGTSKKTGSSSGTGAFGYIGRNLIIIAGLLVVFFIFWNLFSKERRLSELTSQFYKLRSVNPNSSELRDVYNEIMMIQPEVMADTSYIKRLLRGYHWAIHDMALGSFDDIKEREEKLHQMGVDSTAESLLDAKRSMKIGLYPFIKEIIKRTPKDAVILLPAGDSAVSNNGSWNFIYDPEWMEYFLYPRLCVAMGAENQHPELAQKVTHVVIIEGKGYEHLKYEIPLDQRPKEAILPIDHPPGVNETGK